MKTQPLQSVSHSDFGDTLIKDYLEVFDMYSFKNQNYGRMSLHVILGQALKNVYYRVGARKIDARVHLLLIKPSGTGKGAGYGFVVRMAEKIGLDFQHLTESTDAGLAGSLDHYDEKLKEWIVNHGLLETADIVGMEEASTIFDYSSQFSKKNLTYLQIAMNPLDDVSCCITKRLAAETIEFKPHASFILLSYPPDKLEDAIAKRGIIQRFITIFEEVTLEDRMDNIRQAMKNVNKSSEIDIDKSFNSIVHRLMSVVKRYEKDEMCFNISNKSNEAIYNVVSELVGMILRATPIAREKLEEFTHRFYETLTKLAIHHAILSLRTEVQIQDVMYARMVYTPIWYQTIYYIEKLLVLTDKERSRRHRIVRQALEVYDELFNQTDERIVKKGGWVRRETMIKMLQEKWDNCTQITADFNLKTLEKTIGDLEKDKFFERGEIGGVDYLKKIKDLV